MNLITSRKPFYYDLVRIPHGHIPVPRIKLWKYLPMPIKEIRTYGYFHCPECGSPSFFKIIDYCMNCYPLREGYEERCNQRLKGEKNRDRWKKLEYMLLPLLVLLGKAWYVPSERIHQRDFIKYREKVYDMRDQRLRIKHEQRTMDRYFN